MQLEAQFRYNRHFVRNRFAFANASQLRLQSHYGYTKSRNNQGDSNWSWILYAAEKGKPVDTVYKKKKGKQR